MAITLKKVQKLYDKTREEANDLTGRIPTSNIFNKLDIAETLIRNEQYEQAHNTILDAQAVMNSTFEEDTEQLFIKVQDRLTLTEIALEECKKLGVDHAHIAHYLNDAKNAFNAYCFCKTNEIIIQTGQMSKAALFKHEADKKIAGLLEKITGFEEVGIPAANPEFKLIQELYKANFENYIRTSSQHDSGTYRNMIHNIEVVEKIIKGKQFQKVLNKYKSKT